MSYCKSCRLLQKIEFTQSLFSKLKLSNFVFVFVFIAIFPSTQIQANEISSSFNVKRIVSSCNSIKANDKAEDIDPCIFYVQGFLEGAWNIRNVKASPLNIKKQETLTWDERAYKNRVGKRADRHKIKPITYYCSPDVEPSADIINQFLNDEQSQTIQELNAQIYNAITVICPSDTAGEDK